ncbi:hypothetical protein ACWA2C_27055 [Priestia megaterium]
MNILFVFYVPSGGVETLNRQRCKALKKHNINAHCLYYENRKKTINDHGTQTFVTNEDREIKKNIRWWKLQSHCDRFRFPSFT